MLRTIAIICFPLFFPCNSHAQFDVDVQVKDLDQVIRLIEDAIVKIETLGLEGTGTFSAEIGQIRTVISETTDQLIDASQSTIRNELNVALNNAIQAISSEAKCSVVFVKRGFLSDLEGIKDRLLNRRRLPLVPAFCSADRNTIDLSLEPARRKLLVLTGYNFDGTNVQAYLHEMGSNTRKDVTEHLKMQTPYKLVLNLSENGVQFSLKSELLSFHSNGTTLGEIHIQQGKPKCGTKTVTLAKDATKITYIPPHTKGDTDYYGQGPKVNCEVELDVKANQIDAKVYMKAIETWHDYTTAEGRKTFNLYIAPTGWKITKVLTALKSQHSYTDDPNGKDDRFNGNGPVYLYNFVGDTKDGGEAGSKTRVDITFRQFQIELKQTGNCQE